MSVKKGGLVETVIPPFASLIKEPISDLCALMGYAMDLIYAIVRPDGKANNAIWESVRTAKTGFALGPSSVNAFMGGLVKTAP